MNKHNNARLATYLAGAGAAGLVNLPSDLEAEVLYKNFEPDLSLPGNFSAIRLKVTISPTSGLSAAVDGAGLFGLFGDGNLSLYAASFASLFGQPPTARAGFFQGGGFTGKNPSPFVRLYPGVCGGSTIGDVPGSLTSTPALEGEHYLGFQYSTAGNSYNGWIRYEYTPPSDPESPLDSALTLFEGAVESEPGRVIVLPGSCPIPRLALGAVNIEENRLALGWGSKPGMIYNLKSSTDLAADPATWESVEVDGRFDIPSTPPANMHSIARPDDPARFYRVEEYPAPPETVFSDDLESGQGNWTTGSDGDPGSEWELGVPANGGPAAAHSGVHCFGTNLDGDYDFHADVWLRTPVVDLANASGATLSYAQFTDTEQDFDFRKINVVHASDDSFIAEVSGVDGPSSLAWESVSHVLPQQALGKLVKLEFRMTSDDLQNFAGWYIDDVEVVANPPQ